MDKKSVLITGGFGFVGSNLAHECVERGYDVTVLSGSESKKKNIADLEGKVEVIVKDVREIDKEVENRDWIFHCASTGDNYNIFEEPYKDVDVNCTGTIAVLEACRQNNPDARIIYPSTFFVNGNVDELPVGPESPCNPLGLYPATKLAAEHFCKVYLANKETEKIESADVVIARLTNVFGPREQRDNNKKAAFNRMIGTAIGGGVINLYDNGIISRDYIYVDDAVSGLLTIADKGESGQVYYVGRGEGTKFKTMVDTMIEEAGGGTINPISPPKFHKASGIDDFWCDNSMLRGLGWEPKVNIREGIRRTIAWYREEDRHCET